MLGNERELWTVKHMIQLVMTARGGQDHVGFPFYRLIKHDICCGIAGVQRNYKLGRLVGNISRYVPTDKFKSVKA